MAELFSLPVEQVFDSNGDPLSGAKLFFYDTGTSTPRNVFTDNALLVAHTNPVIADSAGRFAAIYLSNADYKAILKTSADVTIWTADPIHGGPANPLFSSISVKSGNYTVLTSDNGVLFPVTATATITMPTAATAGASFRIGVVNAGAGIVTVARSSSDTFDAGQTAVKLAPNQSCVIQSDGVSKWYTIGRDGRGKGADIASAATLALGEDGNYYHVTGTTTITAIEARPTGWEITLEFDGALQLTHNATTLVLFGGQNFTTVAGDVLKLVSESDAGNWRLVTVNGVGQVSGWPEDTAPASNDFVQTLDVSANALKKVKLLNLGAFVLNKTGTDLTVTGTTTETSIYSVVVPANSLGTNGALRTTLLCHYINDSGAGATLTIRIKFGGSTYYADVSASITTNANRRPSRIDVVLYNRNSAASCRLNGQIAIGGAGATTSGAGDLAAAQFLTATVDSDASGISTDTTVDQTFDVTVQHSVASGLIAFSRYYGVSELL